MEKVDFKQLFKQYYRPKSEQPEVIDVPSMQYLMIDGKGSPAAADFEHAIQAMYGVFFTIKFGRRKAGMGPDYSGAPLEGLWWMGDNTSFDVTKKDQWQWTLMLWQPDFITPKDLIAAVTQLKVKKPNPMLDKIRLETIDEGLAVQVMHIGPYSEEGPTVERLHAFAKEQGLVLTGKHHEIYMGDPRRAKPEKLKTILRQPVTKK